MRAAALTPPVPAPPTLAAPTEPPTAALDPAADGTPGDVAARKGAARRGAAGEAATGEEAAGAGREWAAGDSLPGGLVLERRLGHGATAEVWAARSPEGPVAVKALLPALAGRPGMVAALAREGRKGRQFAHPGLVRVLGGGAHAGRAFLVMECLHGRTLAEAAPDGLSRRAVARLLRRPAAALARLHAAGLVHGDVKPGNLFLEEGGGVRLLDLGAARMAADSALDASAWVPPRGLPLATPRWSAPERLHGLPPDPRDDVYSLALVAAALLAGPPPEALRRALGPRAERPRCPVSLVRALLPFGLRGLARPVAWHGAWPEARPEARHGERGAG
ncbi:protein kinase [Roseomonas sp. NAR14]|uniref:Protein kinase n=1 Tax=Roseomonas acroporae TaxID=2937791 RepID=A0A9X1Y6D8_9PROT|nr:protein kinase [Roseomonas acroporae]MCK8784371.1 protein kinase [Roseomonas acroporae]